MTNTVPGSFDLSKINVEAIRKRRRKKLLLLSLPIVIAFLLGALYLLATTLNTKAGIAAYNKKDYSTAADYFGRLRSVNVIERYKMEYNYGTALLGIHRYADSKKALTAALDYGVPKDKECQIRVNLVLAITGEADTLVGAQKFDAAILLYDKAKAVIDAKDCGLKQNSRNTSSEESKKASDQLNKQRDEVTKKQNDAKQKRNGDKPSESNPQDGSSDDNSTPSETQIEQLEEQQQENAQKSRSKRSSARSYNSSTANRDYTKKSW